MLRGWFTVDGSPSTVDGSRFLAALPPGDRHRDWPAREILDSVDDHGIDHVVLGSHGRSGVSRLVLGSVAERVFRQSPVPVTVVR